MDNQNIRIRLKAYDHRVLDGVVIGRTLLRLEEVLRHDMVAALGVLNRSAASRVQERIVQPWP